MTQFTGPSHPTRSSPLPHMHIIANTYDTGHFWNPITPKARFSGLEHVSPLPELQQYLVRDRLVPHSSHRVNIRKLKVTAAVSGPELYLGEFFLGGEERHTGHRVHLETKFIGIPSSRESLLGDITSSLITSSVNGTPAPQKTIFGRNLNTKWGQILPHLPDAHGSPGVRLVTHAHLSMGIRSVFHRSSIAMLSPATSPLAHRLISSPTFCVLSSLATSKGNPS